MFPKLHNNIKRKKITSCVPNVKITPKKRLSQPDYEMKTVYDCFKYLGSFNEVGNLEDDMKARRAEGLNPLISGMKRTCPVRSERFEV